MIVRLSIRVAACLIILAILASACRAGSDGPDAREAVDHDDLRQRMLAHARRVAELGPWAPCGLPSTAGPELVMVAIYSGGERLGDGSALADDLCAALTEATREAVERSGLAPAQLVAARLVIERGDRQFGLVEHEGRAVELVGGLVAVRSLDKAMIRAQIDEGRDYLLRVIDPKLGGVHKFYDAPTDSFEDRLHTIYTASTLYTLIALYRRDGDERLREPIERGAGFLLTMQRVAPGAPGHGAFHYSLERSGRVREPRFVVGTAAKTIFTLIELHGLTGEQRYLDAARLAGGFLLTMQGEGGRVTAELRVDADGEWVEVERESVLYTGQWLSALARLHEATGEPSYLDAASRTADRLLAKLDREGCYLGDDYRSRNPVSSSWAILSLFEYARASGDAAARARAYACADELLDRQIDAPQDPRRHGRWTDSLSSSGSGWLAEVLTTLYLDCREQDSQSCARYRDAVVSLFRLLLQHSYGPKSAFATRNPDMARGGLFWTARDRYVRTDSVCHAMNAYLSMLDALPEGALLELPEPNVDLLGIGAI